MNRRKLIISLIAVALLVLAAAAIFRDPAATQAEKADNFSIPPVESAAAERPEFSIYGSATSQPSLTGRLALGSKGSVAISLPPLKNQLAGGPQQGEKPDEFGVPEALGQPAFASVEIDGNQRPLRPNQLGAFERVVVQEGTVVPVRVSYPLGKPDEEVSVVVQDGGRIGRNAQVETLRLDQQGQIAFEFQSWHG